MNSEMYNFLEVLFSTSAPRY